MDFGIGNYNNVCRDIISRCSNVWQDTLHQIGRWVEFENQYKLWIKILWKVSGGLLKNYLTKN